VAEDKNLTCRDCSKTFVFTAGEQAFFAERGLSDPIRCPDCRRLRKQQRAAEGMPSSMPGEPRSAGATERAGGLARTGGPDRGPARTGGFDRGAGPSRFDSAPPRTPRGAEEEDDARRNFRKARPAASVAARYSPPKKEASATPKEKRPNNRRDEEKLLLNWKEEVGLDEDVDDADWLSFGENEPGENVPGE
jgi:hypothetical protein